MTPRYYALTVILAVPMRDDDAQAIIDAIGMIKGVADVQPLVANAELHWAKATALIDVRNDIMDVLFPERTKGE